MKRALAGVYAVSLCLWLMPLTAQAAACCRCHMGDPNATTCFWTDKTCADLEKRDLFPNLAGIKCPESVGDAQCKKKEDGGSCSVVYQAATFNPSAGQATGRARPADPPTLGIAIPGTSFSTGLTPVDGYLQIPFLGQYVSGFYRYALGMAMVAAAVMITYGGFLYILGATATSVSSGKDKIKDALVGLLIFVSCATILATISPEAAKLSGLRIKVAEPGNSATSWVTEGAKITASATVQPKIQEVPIVSQEEVAVAQTGTTATTTQPSPAQPATPAQPAAGGGAPSVPKEEPKPEPKPGEVIKDASGNYVAMGECPEGMKAIRYSSDYEAAKKVNVPSFCMDVYEAPNQKGVKPFQGVTETEADWYCFSRNKRLCTSEEFTRACLGPKGDMTFGYGEKYVPGVNVITGNKNSPTKKTNNAPAPCNYDSAGGSYVTEAFQKIQHSNDGNAKSWEETMLNPDNIFAANQSDAKNAAKVKKWQTMVDTFEKMNVNRNPSGARALCATAEGIYDLPANVQEITLSKFGAKLTIEQRIAAIKPFNATCPQVGDCTGKDIKPYAWRGFYYQPIAHLANINALPSCDVGWGGGHAIGWRGYENGFRCCMPLKE